MNMKFCNNKRIIEHYKYFKILYKTIYFQICFPIVAVQLIDVIRLYHSIIHLTPVSLIVLFDLLNALLISVNYITVLEMSKQYLINLNYIDFTTKLSDIKF